MTGKRGWQLGFLFALSLILVLSVLAVWQEAYRWRALDKWSLASRYVGQTPNQSCCQQAAYIDCTPCLTSPTCTKNSTATGKCSQTGPFGSGSSAICNNINKSLFCQSNLIGPAGTANVAQCVLTGLKVACNNNTGSECECADGTRKEVTTSYAGCNSQVDACPTQPAPACTQNP